LPQFPDPCAFVYEHSARINRARPEDCSSTSALPSIYDMQVFCQEGDECIVLDASRIGANVASIRKAGANKQPSSACMRQKSRRLRNLRSDRDASRFSACLATEARGGGRKNRGFSPHPAM